VTHKVFKGEALAIEAFEDPGAGRTYPDDPARLKSAPFPDEIYRAVHEG
jgi:4-hydroxybenzoyl-CoA thioesterase